MEVNYLEGGAVAERIATALENMKGNREAIDAIDDRVDGVESSISELNSSIENLSNSFSDFQTETGENFEEVSAQVGSINANSLGVVSYNEAQEIAPEQQAQARDNLGMSNVDLTSNNVKYTEQILTDEQKEQVLANIGLDNIEDLVSDTIKFTEQTLTDEEQQQARENIGLGNINELVSGVVKYSEDQTEILTSEQKAQARDNIGLGNINDLVSGTVKYDAAQTLSDAEQLQARQNIGLGDIDSLTTGNVKYNSAQDLSAEQKLQGRENIDAASSSSVASLGERIAEVEADFDSLGNVVSDVVKVDVGVRVDYVDHSSKTIEIDSGGLDFDGGYVDEDNLLHLTFDGKELDGFTPFPLPATGGGGTVAGTVSITRITNASSSCIFGDEFPIEFNFAAKDSSGDTVGSGVATWSIGGVVVARNIPVPQGDNSFNIGPYLTAGTNSVKISISVDTGGESNQVATKTWTINAVNMYFVWNYDESQINTAAFNDRWTPYGDISKTMHTEIDGVELDTSTTSRSGAQQTTVIPMQAHGSHLVRRWMTAEIGGEPHGTAVQEYSMIFAVEGNMEPIISARLPVSKMDQYDTVRIPVVLYDPSSLTANAELFVDDVLIAEWTEIDRTVQYWNYTPTESGPHILKIACGETTKSLNITVDPIEMEVEEITGYTFRFKASEMATNDAVRNWNSNGITATFSDNFDWINGGLKTEIENGNLQQYLCIKAGTRMTINYPLFSVDHKTNGMNFKMIYKITNCRNYEAEVARCYSNVGLRMYAHEAILNSSGTTVNVPYGEDEHIELEFDIYPAPKTENDGNYRYIMAWIDGVITSCRVYGATDNFVQPSTSQEKIIIGSDDCDVYIYMVKAYPFIISRSDHIDNFIMDAPNATEMVRRYNRNNILDESGQINYERLIAQNPDCRVWLYDIPYMTNNKDDKVSGCQFQQFWGNGDQYYQLRGSGKMSVQGTSSVTYLKGTGNTDINFSTLEDGYGHDLLKGGVKDDTYGNNWFAEDSENPGHAKVYTTAEAEEEANLKDNENLGPEWVVVERDQNRTPIKYIKALGFKLNDNSCPITYSNTKVNFASCEQVNNMCNAAWYQRFNPYPSLTARDCMEFNMGVQFIKDEGSASRLPDDSHFVLFGDNKYHMYSIANMGNSKKNVHVFHDLSNENEVCIEVNDNNAVQMRMVNPDNLSREEYFAAEDWKGKTYYGMRFPDTKNPRDEVKNAWYDLVWWMVTNNPGAHTDEELSSPETYEPYTFRGHDREGLQVLKGTTVSQYAGTYTHDTFERRMAKMLSECEDHMVMDSFIYHFLYLERHTMADNVSKNNFWSSTDLIHWDLSKAYDMDTSDGNNNQGQMVFDYGNEYDDINPKDGKLVFNGGDSAWFVFCANLYEACQTMFINRETAGAWSATAYHNFMLGEQQKVPERCWVECYWYDYLRTYEQGISDEWMSFLDGGQKTHQRKHYEYFEEFYDSSKYRGGASTSRDINFRAYKPSEWAGVEPKSQITITMYNKMYISMSAGTTAVSPVKAERGVAYTIDIPVDIDVGGTQIRVYTAPMIQAISGLEQLYPDTCVFSEAVRLKELTIGSDAEGYSNTFLQRIALGNNKLLEKLNVQNLPNANSVLDLSNCPALTTLDATGSGFTGYEFAEGGMLSEAKIQRPVSINMRNLSYLTNENLTIYDLSALTTLRIENTPNIDTLSIVNGAALLQIVRLIGLSWTLNTADVLNRLYKLQGLNESGYTTAHSVLTGTASIPISTQRKLDSYKTIWPEPDFIVTCGRIMDEYLITFLNADDTPIRDFNGNKYVQYVEMGGEAYDPIQAEEIPMPEMESTQQYSYTFSNWDNLSGIVLENKTVKAVYTSSLRSYTVRWLAREGDVRKIMTNVPYGTEVKFDNDPYAFPSLDDQESNYFYRVFMGWNKSTGFIVEDTDVYAIWDEAQLPPAGAVELKNMSLAQISAVAKNNLASSRWTTRDHIDIRVGKDFNFTNVESEVLAEEQYFDGTSIQRTNIKLFDADAPTFTLAIDYEFTASSSGDPTLVSCFNRTGNEGFRLRYYNSRASIQWGDTSRDVGAGLYRGIVVIRHRKGEANLYVASDNTGSGIYNAEILTDVLPRARATETDSVLTFGGIPIGTSGSDSRAEGWIHWCKIWYADLGNTVISQLASWPHETWRMEYIDSNLYFLGDDSGSRCAATFIANAPLPLLYNMNDPINGQETSTGGWRDSKMRQFTNSRCFDALPVGWQVLLKLVEVRSATSAAGGVITSKDKVYVVSYPEIDSAAEAAFSSIGTLIPWYSSSSRRAKYCGIVIPATAKYMTETYDPTQLTDKYPVINNGDVWVRADTNNRDVCYVYVDQNTYSKHAIIGGRDKNNDSSSLSTPAIINAQGSVGGCWVRAYYMWLRDVYDVGYFYNISERGAHLWSSASSPYAVNIMFSI